MPAGLHTLRDDGVRASAFCRERIVERADLIEHQRATLLRTFDDIRENVPEETHRRNVCAQACVEFGIKQLGLRAGGNEVHAERPVSRRAHRRDLLLDLRGRFPHHAEQTEAARLRYRRGQFRPCRTAHACADDRVTAAQQAGQCRRERGCVSVHVRPPWVRFDRQIARKHSRETHSGHGA